MRWALLSIATIAVVELFLRLGIAGWTRRLLTLVQKVSRTIRSDFISDHWKERALLAYAGKLFAASLTLLVLLVVALLPLAIFAVVGIWTDIPFLALLMDSRSILASVVIAFAYLSLRRAFRHV